METLKSTMNLSRKIKFTSLAVVLGLGGLSGIASASTPTQKIGVFDMHRALEAVDSGKTAKAQMEKEFNAKRKELQDEENSIKSATEEFKKQSLALSDDARSRKQAELQDRILKYQEKVARSEAEFQKKQRDLFQPIFNKLKAEVAEVSRKKEYTHILDRNDNTLHYVQDQYDITSDVIASFNKSVPTKQK